MIEIPHWSALGENEKHICTPGKPAWQQPVKLDGAPCRPLIRCNCGKWCGIAAHHVHADGTITASFYHAHSSTGVKHSSPDGCGWHVFLKLKDYRGGEFPSRGLKPPRERTK